MEPAVDVVNYERHGSGGNVWVEFLVIPSETRHAVSRQMLYSIGLNALILVCDCSAPRTFLRVAEWIEDVAGAVCLDKVPIALVLGGPLFVDWKASSIHSNLIDPIVTKYGAQVIDLSGYTGSPMLEPRQRRQLSLFYEHALQSKAQRESGSINPSLLT
ncbi:hypothetical protein GGF42_005273 [Coemansia sp. RSA 2424]|nr:hypothetical protein GGF42_005273 [Coemansia sp. RSA 2424]